MTKEEIIKIVQSNTEANWQTVNIIEAIESYKQDIRAEAIEELVRRCEAEEWDECCEPCVDMADVRRIAEELKEQKNE